MKFFKKNKETTSRRQLGIKAEMIAKTHLQKSGLKFLKHSYYSRFGEIDLIMKDNDTLVFVEVRCRTTGAQVSAEESISPQKIQRIRKTAEFFLLELVNIPDCRFDVITMSHNNNSDFTIDWIKNAF